MVGDSQNISRQNAVGKNALKKPKNSASRTKESISKMSEKKVVKKDAPKKPFNNGNDNGLSPTDN